MTGARAAALGHARRNKGRETAEEIALVARRELHERGRSRIFRAGTVVVLLAVAAAIVIPVLLRGHRPHLTVGVVGGLPAPQRHLVVATGKSVGASVTVVDEPSLSAAEHGVRDGKLTAALIDERELLVQRALSATDTSTATLFVATISLELGQQRQLRSAGISASEAARLANPVPLPVHSLKPAQRNQAARDTAVYGLILNFILLSQYGSWILLGVVEEKSSRVIEVLLAAIRPVQLLAGKVIGIGLLALGQAALIVGLALILGEAVGSPLVTGNAPVEVVAVLIWLLLGYSFYSWVWAAAGSLAARQEHVQTLAFPLQLPILFGYVVALTGLGSTTPSKLLEVLAYLPPTAPLAMPVLVADGAVSWWAFVASALLSVLATAAAIRAATAVFSRAVLRSGQRVRLREVLRAG
ncbi:MAG TPA: ABC transporter permease [Acidimicrobiales bacterium]|nr:ABC transporter permease [Acidimicrobiales bacterium]